MKIIPFDNACLLVDQSIYSILQGPLLYCLPLGWHFTRTQRKLFMLLLCHHPCMTDRHNSSNTLILLFGNQLATLLTISYSNLPLQFFGQPTSAHPNKNLQQLTITNSFSSSSSMWSFIDCMLQQTPFHLCNHAILKVVHYCAASCLTLKIPSITSLVTFSIASSVGHIFLFTTGQCNSVTVIELLYRSTVRLQSQLCHKL